MTEFHASKQEDKDKTYYGTVKLDWKYPKHSAIDAIQRHRTIIFEVLNKNIGRVDIWLYQKKDSKLEDLWNENSIKWNIEEKGLEKKRTDFQWEGHQRRPNWRIM